MFEFNGAEDGGAATLDGSSPTFDHCVFRSSYSEGLGGAVAGTNGSSPVFLNCLFSGNSGMSGGAAYFSGYAYPYFENCTFVGNSASSRGGGLAMFSSSPAILGCTFSRNSSPEGGAICFWNGTIDIIQTIIAASPTGESIFCGPNTAIMLACCDLHGNADGDWIDPFAGQLGMNGNISADPMFCHPSEEELTLWEDSPCAPFNPANPDCDLIGAWPVGCTTQAVADERSHSSVSLRALHPNPFMDRVRIGFHVPANLAGLSGTTSIHDAAGRMVRTLTTGPWSQGMQWVEWNGRDDTDRPLPSGVYYVRMDCGKTLASARILRVQ